MLFLFLLSFSGLFGQDNKEGGNKAFSLKEAQDYALMNNDSIKRTKLDYEIARKRVKETTGLGLPQVTGSFDFQYFIDIPTQIIPADFIPSDPPPPPGTTIEAQFGTEYSSTAGLQINQLVFDGQYIIGLKAAKTYKSLAQSMVTISETNVRANVAKMYLQALLFNQTLGILKNNLKEVDENLFELEESYKAGFIDETDVDRLRLTRQQIGNQVSSAERGLETVLLVLKFQMGYPMDEEISLTDSFDGLTNLGPLDSEPTAQPEKRPEYKSILLQKSMNDLAIKRDQVGYLPSLYAFGTFQEQNLSNEINYTGDDAPWFPISIVGLKLTLPIFDGLQKAARIQQSRLELQKTELQESSFSRGVQMETQRAYNNYTTAYETYQNEQSNVALAKKIFDRTQAKYDAGVGSGLEVNSAQIDYYAAQGNLLNAAYSLAAAKIDLDKALGNY